ncbi:MAG: ribonuclease R [Desulfuromusa sp.]|jgi:ribonuclease R|nr:ribonuclease R [Desulfuromusa sp.]
MLPLEHKIINLLRQQRKKPLSRRMLAEKLQLRGQERKLLTRILQQLVDQRRVEERKGSYRLREQQKLLQGTFSLAERGYGFLRLDDPEREDMFIPARSIGSAMDGDRVEVSCHFSAHQRKRYAHVHKVLERAHSQVLGHYQLRRGKAEVWPMKKTLGGPILIQPVKEIKNGDVVNIEMDSYAEGHRLARGHIIEHLGAADDPNVDIESVIRNHDLPHLFSEAALLQAEDQPQQVEAADLDQRIDLRALSLVTIDGESAKDFDDAVALRKEADNNYRLWVCIADVAHYVVSQSAIDNDALERGTSVYFPNFCLPMLPEALSNGICSLNPHQDRLVMTAELLINNLGETVEATFYPAVICSQARLTYTQVAGCLSDPEQSEIAPLLCQQLIEMAELATILSQMRQQRGSLDLDLPEVEIVFGDDGQPVDLRKIDRNQAHRLIEEFMLAANEAVASFLTEKDRPFLYRIHEKPDLMKLQDLQQLAAQCGIGMVLGKDLHKSLQQLLDAVKDLPEARMIQQHLLRSLQQARYGPENHGHFGLAASHYCHFTSPIRRYPDLLVHRVLKQTLDEQTSSLPTGKKLIQLGQDCSAKERRAMQAERELLDLRRCQVMAGHVGEIYHGTIASVVDFGFFVELDDIYVDGLVHIRSLNDYFHFDPITMTLTGERRNQSYRPGMGVSVRVKQVELWRRRIDFSLVETSQQ